MPLSGYHQPMTPEYYYVLSPELKRLTDRIEEHCGFEITVTWTPRLSARGALYHGPASMTIHVRDLGANPAVICHELCHAERYFLLGVPFIQLTPPRQIRGLEDSAIDAAENLDNMLEHIIVLREMNERFGFEKDPIHVREDISTYQDWPSDDFSRRCLALCNAALVHFHFSELSSEMDAILAAERLTRVAQDLITILDNCLDSKPRMVEALVKALEIDVDEVQLRARNLRDACDVGGPLRKWLNDGKSTYQPEDENA
jgi:hypothetical protein